MTDPRTDLVTAGRRLTEAGLSPGSSGNLSVRIGDRVYITPTGAALDALDAGELAVLDAGAAPTTPVARAHRAGPPPSKEFPLHLALYQRDPEVTAVVHLHSAHAAARSCQPAWSQRSAVPPLTPYFVMRVGQTPLIPYAPPGDADQARGLADLDFPFRAALLQNHGPVTSGRDMAAAVAAAVELEETSRLLLLLGQHPHRVLTPAEATALAARYGSHWTPAPRA
ncbi:Ribulose-5-phosphate 4-epimerase/Fuculose-1-phosphate aldolase [Streptomyces zhaozhouensis]|uniref:Ribulose-5-phosphate 4-epimerase/Fuculose-1-phosphate aldolase n=1 Tax=Streptomyces zhaozhouensis TaxID=1300267 RepID=A0A286DVK1_9ACTN|nr:class II aldolase/adducin family protein [Streptomyces zhaozhouensis]SOD62640.1 Ribulose-5-phosphate 4-epimerase/Fuculose-1-phosphate aldolase [Streptomyces zhaozhouensis]